MRYKNLPIQVKLFLAFLLVIFFLAVIAFVGVTQINKVSDSSYELYQLNLRPLETLGVFKADFSELRRLFAIAIVRSDSQDASVREGAVKAMRAQYEKVLASGHTHLNRLKEVEAPQSRIDTTGEVIASITNDYGAQVNQLAEAITHEDRAEMLAAMDNATKAAEYIISTINVSYDNSMVTATQNTESVQNASHSAAAILIVSSVIAAVASLLFAFFIGKLIAGPIAVLRKTVNEMAKGNFDVRFDCKTKDEIGALTTDLSEVLEVITGITTALRKMSTEVLEGDIDAKINCDGLTGAYLEMAEGINNMATTFVNDILTFLSGLRELGNGNFNVTLPILPGKKIILNESFDQVSANIKGINRQINKMVTAAAAGNLSERSDTQLYKGDWADIMHSLNQLMESVASPINETEMVLEQIAQGNFQQTVNGNYQGEFLNMKNSINGMIKNMASYIDEIAHVLNALAHNNFDQTITREYIGKFSEIKDALNNIVEKFNNIISDILSAANQVASGSRQISESSMMLAQGAAQQATSTEELSSTVQMINQNTKYNADNANSVKELSSHSKSNAIKGNQEMQNMLASMASIKKASSSISSIIKVINDIAFQTNLLALNAAVEAARAGVYGKGFNVVAEEVRNLAGKSKEAAEETAELIEESINKVNEGTQIADLTAQAFQQIVTDVTAVAGIISDISSATQEQAVAIGQLSEGITQISEVVHKNSATSEETASASEELSSQANLLQNMVSTFQLKKRF